MIGRYELAIIGENSHCLAGFFGGGRGICKPLSFGRVGDAGSCGARVGGAGSRKTPRKDTQGETIGLYRNGYLLETRTIITT